MYTYANATVQPYIGEDAYAHLCKHTHIIHARVYVHVTHTIHINIHEDKGTYDCTNGPLKFNRISLTESTPPVCTPRVDARTPPT
jgi:hypothetical protein